MAGDLLDGKAMKVNTTDNFHRVYTVTPVHLPEVDSNCNNDTSCTLQTISVTEAYYERLDSFDTGKYEIGAVELKAKLMSRQSMQKGFGYTNPDFHADDEVGNRCADINQKAIDWAVSKASKRALDRYNRVGKKLVVGDDKGPYNAGPLWIWQYLEYNDNADKTQTVLQSPMMRTPTDYPISAARGFHYCKLLSPYSTSYFIFLTQQWALEHQ